MCDIISETGEKFWKKWQHSMFNYFATSNQIAYFLRPFEEKKRCSPMDKGWIEFSIKSLEPGRNSEQNGNVQIFSTSTQISYFLRPFEEKNPVVQRRRIGFNFRYHFWNHGETLYKRAMSKYMLHKLFKKTFEKDHLDADGLTNWRTDGLTGLTWQTDKKKDNKKSLEH